MFFTTQTLTKCFQKNYGSLEFETFHYGVKKEIRQKALVDINMFFNTLKIEHVF